MKIFVKMDVKVKIEYSLVVIQIYVIVNKDIMTMAKLIVKV